MFKTFCNSGTIVRGFCSQAHTHQVDLGTRRCLVNVKIVACWKKNSIGEWDSMTRSMRGNADYYNQPMIVGFF